MFDSRTLFLILLVAGVVIYSVHNQKTEPRPVPAIERAAVDTDAMIRQHQAESARECVKQVDQTKHLWPAEMQKLASKVKEECWRD